MKRRITATFLKTNGEPVTDLFGSFSINAFTHDALTFYTKEQIFWWTDSQGRIVANNPRTLPSGFVQPLGVELVCTNTLDIPVKYTCIGNKGFQPFDFLLPSGYSTVELQTLHTTTIPQQDPRYTSLMAYVDQLVDTATINVVAGKNKKLVTEMYTASVGLSALRVIKVQNQNYADCRNLSDLNATKALLEQTTTIGTNFQATVSGFVFDSGWNWTPHQPIFLGYDGFLKQNIEPNSAFVQQIGLATSPQQILVSFKEPILLSV